MAINRFNALEREETEKPPVVVTHMPEIEMESSGAAVDIKDRLRRLIAIADEYFKISNIDDLLSECNSIPSSHHTEMLVKLIGHAMEKGRKEVLSLEPVLIALKVPPDSIQSAIQETFSMLDDLIVDIPAATEYAGFLLAVLARITGMPMYESVLDGNLQARSPMTFLKTAAWFCSFLPPSIPRPHELIRKVLSMVDATPTAIDTLKRCLKDRLFKALPELEQATFDAALNELQSKQSALSTDDFYSSLKHILEPAIRLNPNHLPLILTRASTLVVDYMHSKNDAEQAPRFHAVLGASVPVDQTVSVAILNALVHKASQDLSLFEAIFKSLYNHRLVSVDAFSMWMEENHETRNMPIVEIMSSWIEQLSERESESTSAGQL